MSSGVPELRRYGAHKASFGERSAQMRKISGAWLIPEYRYSGIPERRSSGIPEYRYSGTQTS
jgi:hypothetical protein